MMKLILALLTLQLIGVYSLSFVRVSDEDLLEDAHVAIYGQCIGIAPLFSSSGSTVTISSTLYSLAVLEELKGTIPQSRYSMKDGHKIIRVSVMGAPTDDVLEEQPELKRAVGMNASVKILNVPAAPQLYVGSRLILFLEWNSPLSAFTVLHISQGLFHQVSVLNQAASRLNKRDLLSDHEEQEVKEQLIAMSGVDVSGSKEFTVSGVEKLNASLVIRDFTKFKSWIKDSSNETYGKTQIFKFNANGRFKPPDYFTTINTQKNLHVDHRHSKRYNLFTPSSRWKQFDDNGIVKWESWPTVGQKGMKDGGIPFIQAAMDPWNNVCGARVRLKYSGSVTKAGKGLAVSDSRNTISFGDMLSQVNGKSAYNCKKGGPLAVGGYFWSGTHTWNGTQWHTITEVHIVEHKQIPESTAQADIVVEDGIECWLKGDSRRLESMLAHEIGHSLGMQHSCGDNEFGPCSAGSPQDRAIMRASVHTRGAALRYAVFAIHC